MLFQSCEFLLFFAIVLICRQLLPKKHERLILLIASYVFYSWWSLKFVFLIVATTFIDFYAGKFIHKYKKENTKRKLFLTVSIFINLGLLFFFKYWCWINELFGNSLGYTFVLPLGISFYTFQSMSYTLDVYFKKIKPEKSLIAFASFVSFFPQLVAGPINRAGELLSQLDRGPRYIKSFVISGISIFTWGAVKKVIFADNLALYVNEVYEIAAYRQSLDLLLASYAFAFQIYCDFSGYTDMARGIARLMGYELSMNFNSPYLAKNIRDFWSRWHISLSTWFRDYVYIPLGGNRRGEIITSRNILITMFIAGIWHGANLTFLIWGLFHGLLIVIFHFLSKRNLKKTDLVTNKENKLVDFFKILFTFNLVVLGWIFFRAQSITEALEVIKGIARFDFSGIEWNSAFPWLMIFPILFLLESKQKLKDYFAKRVLLNWILIWIGIFSVIIFGATKATDFIYFQF